MRHAESLILLRGCRAGSLVLLRVCRAESLILLLHAEIDEQCKGHLEHNAGWMLEQSIDSTSRSSDRIESTAAMNDVV